MAGKTIKLLTQTGEMTISNIAEYVCGFSFFYLRLAHGETLSFARDQICEVMRRAPSGEFRPIHLKKVKMREHESQDDC